MMRFGDQNKNMEYNLIRNPLNPLYHLRIANCTVQQFNIVERERGAGSFECANKYPFTQQRWRP